MNCVFSDFIVAFRLGPAAFSWVTGPAPTADADDIADATVSKVSNKVPNQFSNCFPNTTGCCVFPLAVLAFFPKYIVFPSIQK